MTTAKPPVLNKRGTEIRIGQIWRDLDNRGHAPGEYREVKIVAIHAAGTYRRVEAENTRNGRISYIRIDRLHPQAAARGFELLSEPSAEQAPNA